MDLLEAREEYGLALKAGQKDYKELSARGIDPYPVVLDELLEGKVTEGTVDVGTVEIPAERIIGVKSAGRTAAFTRISCPCWTKTASLPISGSICVLPILLMRVSGSRHFVLST